MLTCIITKQDTKAELNWLPVVNAEDVRQSRFTIRAKGNTKGQDNKSQSNIKVQSYNQGKGYSKGQFECQELDQGRLNITFKRLQIQNFKGMYATNMQ